MHDSLVMESWDYKDDDDLRRMQELSTRIWARNGFWHAGGTAWAHRSIANRGHPRHIRLWGEGGRASAWGWPEFPGILVAQSSDATLAPEIVEWYENVGRGHELVAVVPETHTALATALLARGFVEDPEAKIDLDMRRPTSDPPRVELHEGYTLRSVTADDLSARVAVHRAAWEPSRVTEESYRIVMATWPYREDLDIVAVAPDGKFAASCIAWFEPSSKSAEFEPVGTHPDHRRRGLASAVCAEAIARLERAGCVEITVGARGDDAYPVPRHVYGQLGFVVVNRTRTYHRGRLIYSRAPSSFSRYSFIGSPPP